MYDVVGAELETFFGDNDDTLRCTTVVDCFKLVLYKAIPAGEMAAVMDDVDQTQDKFESRMIFDLAFFIWVGLLLFNILTGKLDASPFRVRLPLNLGLPISVGNGNSLVELTSTC